MIPWYVLEIDLIRDRNCFNSLVFRALVLFRLSEETKTTKPSSAKWNEEFDTRITSVEFVYESAKESIYTNILFILRKNKRFQVDFLSIFESTESRSARFSRNEFPTVGERDRNRLHSAFYRLKRSEEPICFLWSRYLALEWRREANVWSNLVKKCHNFCLASVNAIRFREVRRSEWAFEWPRRICRIAPNARRASIERIYSCFSSLCVLFK